METKYDKAGFTGKDAEKLRVKLVHDPLLHQMFDERNVRVSTRKGYFSTVIWYCLLEGFKDVKSFLDEAEAEEKKGVRMKDRKIKQHLLHYRHWLNKERELAKNTAHTYLSKLMTVYRHYEIELPELPQIKVKNQYIANYYDIPNRGHLKQITEIATTDFKALVLFMSSSGTAKAETLSITCEMFFEGLKKYVSDPGKSLFGQLMELKDRRDLVPCIYLNRIKTDKWYYTCCSPEATYYVLKWLYIRFRENAKVPSDARLFPMSNSLVITRFQEFNDKMGWGFVGKYRFFRSHTLRKYHASNLGTSAEMVDTLEGRSKDKVHATYIKTNPDDLTRIYKWYMHNVMVEPEKWYAPGLGNTYFNPTMDPPEYKEVGNGNGQVAQQVQQVPQPQVQHMQQVPMVQQPESMETMTQDRIDVSLFMKEIGKLELRMEQLEQQIKEMVK